jgi:hypothetical protein
VDILDIKKIVNDLPEKEVRTYLSLILSKIALLEDKEYSLFKFSNDLKDFSNHILFPENPNYNINIENYKKVHLVFGYPYLRHALRE